MASRSRQPAAAPKESILTPVLTLKGHTESDLSISYFPDGKRIFSGSRDRTARRWDLEVGKEIEGARDFCQLEVHAVAVSRDGRWVVVGGGPVSTGELRVCEVETGIVRRFKSRSRRINCIDISPDSSLLASGSEDMTVMIWSLDTGKLVAGPFKSTATFETTDIVVGTVRFSQDLKKIAMTSIANMGRWIEVWDVQTQKLDVRMGNSRLLIHPTYPPVFWTAEDKTIVAVFGFSDLNSGNMIYEFDASTLRTVGTPFKGHTNTINGLALSSDCALLASASGYDNTIKLWAFESRQLLASFHVQIPRLIIFSPDSRQLAYTIRHSTDIYVCNTPLEILASIQTAQQASLPQSYTHPRELLASSSHTDTVLPLRNDEYGDPFPDVILQNLTEYVTKDEDHPAARGGFGEIWKCTYSIDRTPTKVAVKALQVYAVDHSGPAKTKKNKRIKRELRICANLKHKNILPVYGYTYGFGPFMAIVSPWAENGNLTAYLEREGAELTLIRRFQILRDIIAGLRYLHTNGVIHGDFNGPNVLIHGDGTACVADFGLSLMYSEVISASQASWTSTLKGNVRWMAPELLEDREDGSQVRPSEQSDMYSFGGIMLQVLTNKIPYYHLSNDAAIVLCIAKSQTPSRSRYPVLPETCWQFIEKCWSTDPRDRPSTKGADGMIRKEYHALSNLELFSIQPTVYAGTTK